MSHIMYNQYNLLSRGRKLEFHYTFLQRWFLHELFVTFYSSWIRGQTPSVATCQSFWRQPHLLVFYFAFGFLRPLNVIGRWRQQSGIAKRVIYVYNANCTTVRPTLLSFSWLTEDAFLLHQRSRDYLWSWCDWVICQVSQIVIIACRLCRVTLWRSITLKKYYCYQKASIPTRSFILCYCNN